MDEPPRTSNRPGSGGRPAWPRDVPLVREMVLYAVVSALDVWMTYILLSRDDVHFYESNPVARFFIDSWGRKGMIAYKAVLVAIVCSIAQIIARRRPVAAQRILQFAIVVAALVVIYGLLLLLRHR